MDTKFCVYLHITKDTGEVFYVGKGVRSRPTENCSRSVLWNNVANKHGREVRILYKNLSDNTAKVLEKFWIAVYGRRDIGTGTLVNHTEGGDGTSGCSLSEEHKAAIRRARLGKKMSKFNKQRLMDALTGAASPHFKGTITATNILSGDSFELSGTKQIQQAGFHFGHVYACVNGKQKKHRGYTFSRV